MKENINAHYQLNRFIISYNTLLVLLHTQTVENIDFTQQTLLAISYIFKEMLFLFSYWSDF